MKADKVNQNVAGGASLGSNLPPTSCLALAVSVSLLNGHHPASPCRETLQRYSIMR